MSENLVQPFDSEAGFRAGIDLTLAAARRELRIFDRDLARMQLESPARVAALTAYFSSWRGTLRLVLHDTGLLESRSPRLVTLFRTFGHLVQVRHTPESLRQLADCWILADQAWGAVRFHADQPRGKLLRDAPEEARYWWDRFDELWAASEPCTPGSVTGL